MDRGFAFDRVDGVCGKPHGKLYEILVILQVFASMDFLSALLSHYNSTKTKDTRLAAVADWSTSTKMVAIKVTI